MGYGSLPHSRSTFGGQNYNAPYNDMAAAPCKTRGVSVGDVDAGGCYDVGGGRSMTSLRTYDSGVSVFYHSDNGLVKHQHTRTASAVLAPGEMV